MNGREGKTVLAVLRGFLLVSAVASANAVLRFTVPHVYGPLGLMKALTFLQLLMPIAWLAILWGTLELLRRKREGLRVLQWSVGAAMALTAIAGGSAMILTIDAWPKMLELLSRPIFANVFLLQYTPLPQIIGLIAGVVCLFFLRSAAVAEWLRSPGGRARPAVKTVPGRGSAATSSIFVVILLVLVILGFFMMDPAINQTIMGASFWISRLLPVVLAALLLFVVLRTVSAPLASTQFVVSPGALKALRISLIALVIALLPALFMAHSVTPIVFAVALLFLLNADPVRLYAVALAGGLGLLWISLIVGIPVTVLYALMGLAMRTEADAGSPAGLLAGIPMSILRVVVAVVPAVFAAIAIAVGYRTFLRDSATTA